MPPTHTVTPLLLVSTVISLNILCVAAEETPCTTPTGKIGRCVSYLQCSPEKLWQNNTTLDKRDFLKKSLCDIHEHSNQIYNKVCCPLESCTTPDGTQGTCVGLLSCPRLLNLVQFNRSQDIIRYVQTYKTCSDPNEQVICCGQQPTSGVTTQITGENVKCQLEASPPHPSSECCGLDSDTGPKIVGGTAAGIREYPWLALIKYREVDDKINNLCNGALISGLYVVTVAHCTTTTSLEPINVILGEYNTNTPGPDCVIAAGGGEDCTDGSVSIPINKSILHPDYNSKSLKNDIALIKLNRAVEFTEFIRPICLPTVDFTATSSSNVYLYNTGWGKTERKSSSNIKMKVRLSTVLCQDIHYSRELWDKQICAGGYNGTNSCSGDSGGPLMRVIENRHELVGIVSFGPNPCTMDGSPGVNTKIYSYLPWIRSQITE